MESGAVRSLLLDAGRFYDSPELSDVTVVLMEEFEEAQERAAERQRTGGGADAPQDAAEGAAAERPTVRLHGHKFLLSACSGFFKASNAHWSRGDGDELVLLVPSLEVGKLLIRNMYLAQPQLQDCSQQQLLELVVLADRYDVNKVMVAARAQLQLTAAQGHLEMGTAQRIMSLPTSCPGIPAFKPLYQAAVALKLRSWVA